VRQDPPVAASTSELGSLLLARLRALPAAGPLLALEPAAPVHLVGGATRDLIDRRQPRELDLAIEGDALEVARALGGRLTVHDRFGTCTVLLDGWRYDLARTRRERYPRPGALPLVEPAGLDEDLARRDFTVNAIALSLAGTAAGRLAAVEHALDDLAARRLRVLHDRSFEDDPTRLLRLARYAARLRFAVEPHTAELARAAVAQRAADAVSASRLGAELRLLAVEEEPLAALAQLAAFGLDRQLLGRFGAREHELASRALELLPPDGQVGLLALAASALGRPPAALRERLDALAFPAAERDVILAAATRATELAGELGEARSPAQIAAAARGAPPEAVALAGALGGERAHAAAREWLSRLRHVRLEITGEDLLAAGLRPGPEIGAGLRAALAAKLDARVRGRDQELAEALRAATAVGD
jgi:tRNA nucleotidyltransferase (CCA-adding enzyme)